ncbi:MAG TPA: thermonuclease family protein, partial [Candidatus Paceibacterota bacterium]|nr:thermonuclease family protein [Candidatus Paceibacterota bacterium]
TVRVMGIDTPETVDPRKPVECFGPQASAEGKHLLTGQDVRLVADPTGDEYDMYGRMLAYVYLPGGTFYNEFMIRNGFAHEYTFKKAYEFQKEFRAAQAAAKQQQLGFWSPATCNGNTGVGSSPTPLQ